MCDFVMSSIARYGTFTQVLEWAPCSMPSEQRFIRIQHICSYKRVNIGVGCQVSLQWRHNGRYGVLNHQPHDCLLNR